MKENIKNELFKVFDMQDEIRRLWANAENLELKKRYWEASLKLDKIISFLGENQK